MRSHLDGRPEDDVARLQNRSHGVMLLQAGYWSDAFRFERRAFLKGGRDQCQGNVFMLVLCHRCHGSDGAAGWGLPTFGYGVETDASLCSAFGMKPSAKRVVKAGWDARPFGDCHAKKICLAPRPIRLTLARERFQSWPAEQSSDEACVHASPSFSMEDCET